MTEAAETIAEHREELEALSESELPAADIADALLKVGTQE